MSWKRSGVAVTCWRSASGKFWMVLALRRSVGRTSGRVPVGLRRHSSGSWAAPGLRCEAARAVGCPWGVPSGAVEPTCAAGVETNTGSARFGEIGLEGSINLFPVEGMRFGTSFERFDVLPCVTWDIWTIWRSGIIVAKKVVSVEDIGQTSRRKKWIEFKL